MLTRSVRVVRTVFVWAVVPVLLALLVISNSYAVPVYLDETHFVDVGLSVATSITLAPGQEGFLPATIRNLGTQPIIFQAWDSSRLPHGYGFDFNLPGASLVAFSSMGFTPGLPPGAPFLIGAGHVDPLIAGSSCCFVANPDFSNLSGVTIAVGETLTFDVASMLLQPGVAPGLYQTITTSANIFFGDPIFHEFHSANFPVDVIAGPSFSSGQFQQIDLTPRCYPGKDCILVPEPTMTVLALLGAGGLGAARWISRRRR
jgi:hypothetical protein